MKRCVVYRLVAAFFCLAILGSVHAQSIKTFDREVCSGATLFLDGGLYQILSNDCEIISIKANGTGSELYDGKADKRITLTATTKYHIQYKDNAHPGGTVAYAEIKVIAPPTLKVTVTTPKPLPAAFCKDTKVTLNATSNTKDVYWTISSDDTYSETGEKAEFTLTESCWITAQSYNACGFVDSSIYFPVITEPDLSKARLLLKSEINGTFCMDCGFFPKAEEIIVGATQGIIKESSITWEDGSTTEETIKAGVIFKNLKVHAVIEQESAGCGVSATATKVIDTTFTFTIPGGVNCKPTMQTAVSVKPCRDGEVQLRNQNKNLCAIQGRPTLTAESALPKIVIQENKDFPYDQGNGKELYRWSVRWENYAQTNVKPSLTANASYSISCPYSKNKPTITGSLTQKVNVVIDTSYLTFKYEYCPDGKASLEIKGQENIVEIKSVTIVNDKYGSLSFNDGIKDKHLWRLESSEFITTALLEKYTPIRVKVTFDVKDGNCQFTLVREEVVRIKQRNNCTMEFELVPVPATSKYGDCIGVSRGFRLKNAGDDVVADSVIVDPHPVFTFKRTADKMGIEPYYAGAPEEALKKDSIIATIYYHMQGFSGTLSITKRFNLQVKACPPTINDDVRINSATCPTCPGTDMRGTVTFNNPTTKEKDLKVEVISTSVNRKNAGEKYTTTRQEYTVARYLFGDMNYRIAVTYNEGDSIYMIPKMSFSVTYSGEKNYGESVTAESIKMADICGQMKESQPDSICEGEMVDLYVYSRNFLYDTLKNIIWDNPDIQPVGTGIEEWPNYQYMDSKGGVKTKKIKRFHYRVQAKGSGIYPFLIRTKIRDSVIERRDTIRVAILQKPRIFIQDTVYACLNAPVNLWKYVDSSSVDVTTLKSTAGMVINSVPEYDSRVATADLRYNCTKKNISERIHIKAQPSVYNAFIPDAAYCPGEKVTLSAKTNGRVTWTRRRKLEGGGLSQADTLFANGENKILFDEMGGSDQFYTVTARTGCDQPPFQTVQFWANVKSGPEISIQDAVACGSTPVTLKADYDATKAGSLKWTADGKPVASPYVVKSPDPSRDYTMKVEGTVTGTIAGVNDCPSSATAKIQFYASPTVAIQGKNSTGVLCVDGGVSVRIQAQGDASNQYGWYLKGNSTAPIGKDAVLSRAFQKDTLVYVVASNSGSCTAADSVRIVLNGKKRTVADTTVCMGSKFSFSMPQQKDVSYRWYAPDGTPICPCGTISFTEDIGFTDTDKGTYKVEIIRKGCTVIQNIDIKGYPVPDMDFGTTENPVRFCEGSPLVLRMQPKIDGKVVSGYFVWTNPVGTEVLTGDGENTYHKTPVLMVDNGVYTASVTLQNGCTHSASVNVRVDEHTQPDFSLQPYYCEGDKADLNAVYQGDGSSYEWFSESGRHMGPAADLLEISLSDLTPQESGRLYLVVTRGACKDTTYRNLDVRERPTAEVEVHGGIVMDGERFFCEGESVLIALRNVSPGDTTRWVLPNGDIRFNVDDWHANKVTLSDMGEYSVEVVRNGCASAVETVNLDVRVVPVLILQDTFLCQGREIVVNVENADYPGAVYTWKELGVQAPGATLDKSGEYHIEMNLRGCTDEGSFRISERPVPDWFFPSDTSICNRDSLLLRGPEGADSYLWQDGSRERWLLVRNAGLYTLTVTDSGCANEKSVYVETEFCTPVFFPSAFTPNGDGINDRFGPISLAEAGELEYAFFVYNANGQLVFQSTDISRSWDGTFKGQPCQAGIYTYRCKIIVAESGRDLSRTGTVHLIR